MLGSAGESESKPGLWETSLQPRNNLRAHLLSSDDALASEGLANILGLSV